MNWIKIDNNNLPDGEVLAANFDFGTYGYKEKLIGYLTVGRNQDSKIVTTCVAGKSVLLNCTHYIDINKFDLT